MDQARLMSRQYLLSGMMLGAMLFLAPGLRSQELTVSGTQQQTNDRIKELTSNSKPPVHDYIIGDGDLLSISVFDVPELSRDVRVSQTGKISIPLVPVRLEVTGLNELQAEQKIAEVLESNGLVSAVQKVFWWAPATSHSPLERGVLPAFCTQKRVIPKPPMSPLTSHGNTFTLAISYPLPTVWYRAGKVY